MNQLPDISSNIKRQLAFSCTFEKDRIPPRDPEADQLYKHARWLRKSNLLKKNPSAYPAIERMVRISTAYGHDKANIELREMLGNGQAVSDDPINEAIDLVQDLIKRGVPSGYYGLGWYLEHGYGVRVDQDLAFKYYRKSADLGNPAGQYLVGDKLTNLRSYGPEIFAIGWEMYRCAGLQDHVEAADMYGRHLMIEQDFPEAAKFFQLATQNGSDVAAHKLSKSFSAAGNGDELSRLDHKPDPERERRYEKIADFLSAYSYLNPRVPEIDQIVPLPPAKLPDWNGKFEWLQAHEANVPPPLPSEERIAEMARAKGLDPKTGRALSQAR
jgi:TPR repeat protein